MTNYVFEGCLDVADKPDLDIIEYCFIEPTDRHLACDEATPDGDRKLDISTGDPLPPIPFAEVFDPVARTEGIEGEFVQYWTDEQGQQVEYYIANVAGGDGADTFDIRAFLNLIGAPGDDTKGGVTLLSGDQVYVCADGGAGDDTLTGGRWNDAIFGGDDNDTIFGKQGDDILFGDAGNDTIDGEDGDDEIQGGSGQDSLLGSAGEDSIMGGDNADRIAGGADSDKLEGGNGDDIIRGGGNSDDYSLEYITGGDGNDNIKGGEGRDVIYGDLPSVDDLDDGILDNNDDTIEGNEGDDFIDGQVGNDTIDGGDGDDEIVGGSGEDDIFGGAGNDDIFGGDDADKLRGGSGDDEICGGEGNDRIAGQKGNDNLFGEGGNDKLFGGGGDDLLVGGTGEDMLKGGGGNDTLVDGVSENMDGPQPQDENDVLNGGKGDDTLIASGGDDNLIGGKGSDVFKFIGDNDAEFVDPPGPFNAYLSGVHNELGTNVIQDFKFGLEGGVPVQDVIDLTCLVEADYLFVDAIDGETGAVRIRVYEDSGTSFFDDESSSDDDPEDDNDEDFPDASADDILMGTIFVNPQGNDDLVDLFRQDNTYGDQDGATVLVNANIEVVGLPTNDDFQGT
ncbi:MAG: calcium-binding protein [Pseudomonadota bacterium]